MTVSTKEQCKTFVELLLSQPDSVVISRDNTSIVISQGNRHCYLNKWQSFPEALETAIKFLSVDYEA